MRSSTLRNRQHLGLEQDAVGSGPLRLPVPRPHFHLYYPSRRQQSRRESLIEDCLEQAGGSSQEAATGL